MKVGRHLTAHSRDLVLLQEQETPFFTYNVGLGRVSRVFSEASEQLPHRFHSPFLSSVARSNSACRDSGWEDVLVVDS